MIKPTKVEAPLGTDADGSEANRDWTNSYASVNGMMLYLASNIRLDISFAVHQCARFKHKTKASHETAMKMMCPYLQVTKDNGLVFNIYKKLVVDCYDDSDFAGLWGHENPQNHVCDRIRNGFVVTFPNKPLFWVSKIQT